MIWSMKQLGTFQPVGPTLGKRQALILMTFFKQASRSESTVKPKSFYLAELSLSASVAQQSSAGRGQRADGLQLSGCIRDEQLC